MKTHDLILLALNGVRARKLRSALTALGIIIGSAAFVALVTLGQGVEQTVLDQLGDLGTEQIRITPGVTQIFAQGPPQEGEGPVTSRSFTVSDVAAVARAQGIIDATGEASGRLEVKVRGEQTNLAVRGIDASNWARIVKPDLLLGRLLTGAEARSVLMGEGAAELFARPVRVNQQIEVAGERFRVVGILEGERDLSVYLPRDAAWSLLDIKDEQISGIVAFRAANVDDDDAEASIDAALLRSRGLNPSDRDFTIVTSKDIRESVAEVAQTVQVFLGSIATISLVVGGIGIANTMFMTVMERAKQIGILKAVGMTRNEVVVLFLFESALLGFIGGVAGSFVGAALAQVLSPPAGPAAGVTGYNISFSTIGTMVVFAVGIGSVAGLIPAFRAASVPAMESLQGP